ncbi:MAG: endonuclease MutS2 [Cyclobacteriaceae bacterium]
MKGYPHDIEVGLGFDEIRKLLLKFCQSEKGAELAEKCKPVSQAASLKKWHDQTRELLKLVAESKGKVQFRFPDIEQLLIRIKVPGSYLNPEGFHELKLGIQTLVSWAGFFENNHEDYPELSLLAGNVDVDPGLSHRIDKVIDEKGELRDSASEELLRIRSKISASERAARSAIQKVLKKAKSDQFTDEDSQLTVRDGRLVIPVRAEFKKRIAGFVHDESATGQTVFIEPGDVLGFNNEVRELKYAENREIIRILITLSDHVRDNLKDLGEGVHLLAKLDFIYAKSRLVDHFQATVPKFHTKTSFKWINAVHPLLYLSHKETGKQVVPLNLSLDGENRILIISGPNAGGKSVALKTVGLIQYMFQCGLPVPVGDGSEFGIFDGLFLDIGDAQSIEDDLSTYSSHLTSMKYFLRNSDKKTLFLIDEFGKGTEPQFGGAIAESVLHELNQAKSYGIVTTHYQNLKTMGDEEKGLFNGAMKYDPEALEPLFELETGKPGSSFAFEIAGKIGLPKGIIHSAKRKLGASHVDYDQLLNQLDKEKSKYEKLTKGLDKDKKELVKIRKDYEDLRSMLDEERKRILKEAKHEARRILENANKDVERVIREIQESKASKERVKVLREEINQKKSEFLEKEKPKKQTPFKVGDAVRMTGQDTAGIVQKIKGKKAEVLFGAMKSLVSLDKLEKGQATAQQQHQRKVKNLGIDLHSKMVGFTHELSIRGMRADEALGKVESFIDEALLLGVDEIKIVHGKGHGVLRNIVRNYTKDHPGIESVEDEHADRGGDGISIVKLQ